MQDIKIKKQYFLQAFFARKIIIAKWKFNLFGVVCVSLGIVAGFYLTLSGAIPKIFAITGAEISKTSDIDFSQGSFDTTEVHGSGNGAKIGLMKALGGASNSDYQNSVSGTPGLISYWKMDEGSGTVLSDSEGSNNGIADVPTFGVDGKVNKAVSLDGSNDIINVENPRTIGSGPFSIEFWVKMSAPHENINTFISGSTDSTFIVATWDHGDGVHKLTLWTAGNWDGTQGTTDLADDSWHHIAIVGNGANVKGYVDGQAEITIAQGNIGATDWEFGRHAPSEGWCNSHLGGQLDEVRYYSKALTAQDVANHYNDGDGQSGSPEAGLVAGWHLDETTGNVAAEYSGNNHIGMATPPGILWEEEGKYNSGINFDGSGNHINVGNVPLNNRSFTIEFWESRNSTARDSYILGQGDEDNNRGLHVGYRGDDIFTFAFYGNDLDVGPYSDTDWHLWTLTYDAETKERKIYRDGEMVGSDHPDSNYLGTGDLSIGRRFSDDGGSYDGKLDELSIYNVVLDQRTIIDHYSGVYATDGTWESAADSNVMDMIWNGGWGDGVDDDSTAFSATVDNVGSDGAQIAFQARVGATVEDMLDADYQGFGTANSGTEFTATKYDLDDAGLAVGNNRYMQVRAVFSQDSGLETSAELEDFTVYFMRDNTPPEDNASSIIMKREAGGANVVSNGWTNKLAPYFSWTEASEDPEQSGIKGYCLYLGSDVAGNPVGSKGLLGVSPVETAGTDCDFIVSNTYLDFANASLHGSPWLVSSNSPYYLNIKAIDNNNNITNDLVQFQFRFDNTPPVNPAYFSLPGDFISNKEVSFIWPVGDANAAHDNNSGLAGLQYKIGTVGTWYGDAHIGTEDATDLLINDGLYSTQEVPDFENIHEGANFVYLRTWDLAGNISSTAVQGTLKINSTAPSMPLDLTVTPDDNDQNAYAFSWNLPETFNGQASNLNYCYTINTLPSIATCTYTGKGVVSLPSDAYATNPGQNTFYLATKDEAGNINYDVYAHVNFTYSGSAPGIPRNPDVADISIKATSNWKLALSWDAPSDEGAGIESYKIYRSENNIACATDFSKFSEIGATAGTSYADMGLRQKNYYYCIKACDSANSCSASSATVAGYPTGKYTAPAELTSSPSVSNITTKRATISWTTDRDSDSKVAYGEKSNDYNTEEASTSKQTTAHEINLTNLSPGKTYYFRTKWTDEDGNTGTSSEKAFKTDPAPTVKDVVAKNIGLDRATIGFTSRGAEKVKIYYGKTADFGGSKEISTSTSEADYSLELAGLEDGVKYYYQLNSFDSEGEEYSGTILDFTTIPRPKISSVKVQQVMDSAQPMVLVTWNSNTEISSIVSYYPENNQAESRDEIKPATISGEHKMLLKGLFADTNYMLVARGVDKSGNEAISDSYKFTTASDTRPPVIADLNVEGDNINLSGSSTDQNISQLIVSWNTDEPAFSQVEFGEGAGENYPQRTQEDANLTYNHLVVISGLTPSKVYHLRAVSKDKAGNISNSIDMVSITPKESENALNLVITSLQQTFGFLKNN